MFKDALREKLGSFPRLRLALQTCYQLRNLPQQAEIFQDYQHFRNDYPFFNQQPNGGRPSGRRKVLIVSLTNFLFQVKLEALLGRLLFLEGCSVDVLTLRQFVWPRKYFQLFGLKELVYFGDYLCRFEKTDFSPEADRYFSQALRFQDVKKWQYAGCRIGQQILSSMARKMYGTPDLEQPEVKTLLRKNFIYNLRSICAAQALLKERPYDILLFNEPNGTDYGGFFDSGFQQGKDLIFFGHCLRDDSMLLKRYNAESMGLHPNSLSPSTFERIKSAEWTPRHEEILNEEFQNRYGGKWFLSQRNFEGTQVKSREEVLAALGLSPDKKTAVVFSHVLWDANLFYGEDIFADYEQWFVETVKAARGNANVNWIIKFHPANIWKRARERVKGELREDVLIREKVGRLPGHVALMRPETDINAFSLFSVADYGITGRGTIGMELPAFGIPVLTAGTGRYSGLGFTVDSASREEYLNRLKDIQNIPRLTDDQVRLAKKFAFTVFNLRPWRLESLKFRFDYRPTGEHPLDHNYDLMVRSLDQMRQASDLKRFTEWVLNSQRPDYLEDARLIVQMKSGGAC